jgi:hypothetical protein
MKNDQPYLVMFRVRGHVNSWNIAGWCVEAYWPISRTWLKHSRMYITCRGALACMKRLHAEQHYEDLSR